MHRSHYDIKNPLSLLTFFRSTAICATAPSAAQPFLTARTGGGNFVFFAHLYPALTLNHSAAGPQGQPARHVRTILNRYNDLSLFGVAFAHAVFSGPVQSLRYAGAKLPRQISMSKPSSPSPNPSRGRGVMQRFSHPCCGASPPIVGVSSPPALTIINQVN